MDKALRPSRLETLPNSTDASKVYKHWKKTFEYYIAALPQTNLNKLHVLTNFVAPDIFDIISEDTTYNAALATLDANYIKAPNVIYARHLLATRKQQPGESFDSYLAALKSLAKDCNFQTVSAATYQNESIRDAFIAGTFSTTVRQRLLEKNTITLDEMITTARSLESAEKNAEGYSSGNTAELAAMSLDEKIAAAIKSANSNNQKLKPNKNSCWNCGNAKHPQSKCPARDAVCHTCDKVGHWAKWCRTGKQANKQSAAANGGEPNHISDDKSTASAIFRPNFL